MLTYAKLSTMLSYKKLDKLVKKPKIFKKYVFNTKKNYTVIDTTFRDTHITIFADQWDKYDLFHITIGENDVDKCVVYFKYDRSTGDIIEPPGFLYEQKEFNDHASRRPRCLHPSITRILEEFGQYLAHINNLADRLKL